MEEEVERKRWVADTNAWSTSARVAPPAPVTSPAVIPEAAQRLPGISSLLSSDEPFADWFSDLAVIARAKVTRAIARMEQGNFSNVKAVGEGVLEYRIDFGPGYRVYFGRDGDMLVILGGTKKRQQRDIDAARAYWQDYKQAKRERR